MTTDPDRRQIFAIAVAAAAGTIGGALVNRLSVSCDDSSVKISCPDKSVASNINFASEDKVDPRQFGAKFDGRFHVENGPALQCWIDSLKGTEKVGFLPPGQCHFDTSLISTLAVSIEGAGDEVSKLVYIGTGPALRLAATTIGASGNFVPRLKNFSIYNINVIASGNATIAIVNMPGAQIVNVSIYGGWQGLAIGPGTFAARLDSVKIKNTADRGIVFASDQSANNSRVTNSFIYDSGSWGIDIPSGDGAAIIGTTLEGNKGGISVGLTTALTIDQCYIEYSNNLSGFGNLMFYAPNYGTRITSNWLGAAKATVWKEMIGATVVGNTLYNYQVSISPECADVTVGANRLLGSATLNEPPYASPVFKNGWSAGMQAPGYKRDNTGTVRLRGSICGGGSNSVPFTLPAGYRPSDVRVFASVNESGAPARALVYANGDILVVGEISSSVYLDSISFQAAP